MIFFFFLNRPAPTRSIITKQRATLIPLPRPLPRPAASHTISAATMAAQLTFHEHTMVSAATMVAHPTLHEHTMRQLNIACAFICLVASILLHTFPRTEQRRQRSATIATRKVVLRKGQTREVGLKMFPTLAQSAEDHANRVAGRIGVAALVALCCVASLCALIGSVPSHVDPSQDAHASSDARVSCAGAGRAEGKWSQSGLWMATRSCKGRLEYACDAARRAATNTRRQRQAILTFYLHKFGPCLRL
jgi:hypothetical protein